MICSTRCHGPLYEIECEPKLASTRSTWAIAYRGGPCSASMSLTASVRHATKTERERPCNHTALQLGAGAVARYVPKYLFPAVQFDSSRVHRPPPRPPSAPRESAPQSLASPPRGQRLSLVGQLPPHDSQPPAPLCFISSMKGKDQPGTLSSSSPPKAKPEIGIYMRMRPNLVPQRD